MRNFLLLCLLFIVAPFLTAMGVMGKPPPLDRAPEPKERLDALVVDQEGLSTRITCVSYAGELYLPAYRGKALITIPFQKISRIEFGPKDRNRRKAFVHFGNQPAEEFAVEDSISFVGTLPIGTYQIQVRDVQSITFMNPGAQEKGIPASGGKCLQEE